MTATHRDFRAAPVPIRLSCPFSNGITLNYYARALSCSTRVLRVLSVNPFERELQLIVSAPFLNSLERCEVASIVRSKRQASTYEIDLRFVHAPISLGVREVTTTSEQVRVRRMPDVCPNPILSADIAEVAGEVASALETSLGIPFAKAYAQVRNQNRHLKLLALIAALIELSREKSLAQSEFVSNQLGRKPNGLLANALLTRVSGGVAERRVG